MTRRAFDPLCLDVAAFAAAEASQSGAWPLAGLSRLAETASADRPVDGDVTWSVRGERRARRGAPADAWLHLHARTRLFMQCQRCLEPVKTPLAVDRALCFVDGEAQAAALDAESDDDVLALTRTLDVRSLVEDELLLALPVVPRHGTCPEPLLFADTGDVPADPQPNPFLALKDWPQRGPADDEH